MLCSRIRVLDEDMASFDIVSVYAKRDKLFDVSKIVQAIAERPDCPTQYANQARIRTKPLSIVRSLLPQQRA